MGWNSFFHDRTGKEGLRIAGYMRIGFALMFLIDRIMMLFQLDELFNPEYGLMPYRITSQNYQLSDWNQYSLFSFFPESMAFIWIMAGIGILQGFILLLGATNYLRFHLFGLYINIMSFQNHNALLWDGEDNMFRIWVILFLFLPLDHCTIYDRFGFGSQPPSCSWPLTTSWPMWPIRLFQFEVSIIYVGASLGKLAMPYWQDGSSIYRLTYGIDDYPGIFNPEFLYGRYGPLMIMSYSSLFLEGVCYMTVWIRPLRTLSVFLMVVLHIGIDLGMNMHMFEWLSILGWCVFLIQPKAANEKSIKMPKNKDHADTEPSANINNKSKVSIVGSFVWKTLVNLYVIFFTVSILLDCFPYKEVTVWLPTSARASWKNFIKKKEEFFETKLDPYLTAVGLSQQGDWGMYSNVVVNEDVWRIDAELTNGTIVRSIWRSPNWHEYTNWERKFHCRTMNYFGAVLEEKLELEHLIGLKTKPFIDEHPDVQTLFYVTESVTHAKIKMESTGGFWDPVVKHPMNVYEEENSMILNRQKDGEFVVTFFQPNDDGAEEVTDFDPEYDYEGDPDWDYDFGDDDDEYDDVDDDYESDPSPSDEL